MRLLVITQAVDRKNPALGFFHGWLRVLAERADSVVVICLFEGEHDLPENVRVYSLGKERGSKNTLLYTLRFVTLAFKLRKEYDSVFVHMNPEYLIIAGPFWRLFRKKVGLWYMHKTVSWRLRLGVLFADFVFTASPRSMRIDTKKKRVVGHGIWLPNIEPANPPAYPPLLLLTVGRISRIKRIEILLDAVARLRLMGIEAHLSIVGAPATEGGEEYLAELKKQTEIQHIQDLVNFVGAVPNTKVSEYFSKTHLFIHASNTGSLDKASLESLVAGVPVVTCDEELAAGTIPGIIYAEPSGEAFAGAIEQAAGARIWQDKGTRSALRKFVMDNHNLESLIPKILAPLEA